MKKEILYFLVSYKDERFVLDNIVDLEKFKSQDEDLFIFIREEIFLGKDAKKKLTEYYEIPNIDYLQDEDINKIFYTPSIIKLNIDSFLKNTNDIDIFKEIEDLYLFMKKDSEICSLTDFLSIKHID